MKEIISILLTFIAVAVSGQENISGNDSNDLFFGLIQYKNEVVRLRFFIDEPSLALIGFNKGYRIEKSVDGGEYFELSESPLLMWNNDELNQYQNLTLKDPYWVELSHQLASGEFGDIKNKNSASVLESGLSTFNEQYRNLNDQIGFAYLGTLMDFDAALALGIGFVDKDVEANRIYKYRIRPNFDISPLTVEPLELSVKTELINNSRELKKISVFEKDEIIDINFPEDSIYFTYFIDRSIDSITYTREKNIPSMQISATETFDDNIF